MTFALVWVYTTLKSFHRESRCHESISYWKKIEILCLHFVSCFNFRLKKPASKIMGGSKGPWNGSLLYKGLSSSLESWVENLLSWYKTWNLAYCWVLAITCEANKACASPLWHDKDYEVEFISTRSEPCHSRTIC